MIYISKQIEPDYFPDLEEGVDILVLHQTLKENGYPELTLEQLEQELFDLEKKGFVDLEVGDM